MQLYADIGKTHGINYNRANRDFKAGKIPGKIVDGKILIDDNYIPESEIKICCEICRVEMSQITSAHLSKAHNITVQEYKNLFPGKPLISNLVSRTIGAKVSALERTEEHNNNKIKDALLKQFESGMIIHNKGIVGEVKHTEETKLKISEAQIGKTITEEAKAKIRAARKDQIISEESNIKQRTTAKLKGIMPPQTQGPHTAETKLKMKKPPVTCPHCDKQGKGNVMHRWHFDNCKIIRAD
jgi:hypothetical protein